MNISIVWCPYNAYLRDNFAAKGQMQVIETAEEDASAVIHHELAGTES